MIVISTRCKVCQAIKKDKKLLARLYESKYYSREAGRESLQAIQLGYKDKFSLPALKNHCLKHQFIDSVAYNEAMLRHVDRVAENKLIKKAIKATDAVQSVIDKGAERLQNEEITVNTGELLRASQIKINADAKAKDQELKFLEMIAHFASASDKGERIYTPNDDATTE